MSRLSRLGLFVVKEFYRGNSRAITRCGGYAHRPNTHYLRNLPKVSKGEIFQKRRHFSSAASAESSDEWNEPEKSISVTFVDKEGDEHHIMVPIGMSMLEAAHENDIELEGACEGSLACSTCHVIVMDMEYYNKIDDPIDEESDMLDLALGLTETSRLGCQVIASPELDGVRLAVPAAT